MVHTARRQLYRRQVQIPKTRERRQAPNAIGGDGVAGEAKTFKSRKCSKRRNASITNPGERDIERFEGFNAGEIPSSSVSNGAAIYKKLPKGFCGCKTGETITSYVGLTQIK